MITSPSYIAGKPFDAVAVAIVHIRACRSSFLLGNVYHAKITPKVIQRAQTRHVA